MKTRQGVVASAVLALLGLTVGTLPAVAAEPISQDDGNLIIHKYEQPSTAGDAGDGTELPSSTTSGWTPMEGVQFSAYRVTGIDLKTNEGWIAASDQVAKLQAATNKDAWLPDCSGCGLIGQPEQDYTDAAGVIDFENLPVGLYLVKETGYNGTKYDEANIKKAQPFLVTVPLADPDTGAWNYKVHVYPKNTVSSIVKTVDDNALVQVGDAISFSIKTSVPAGNLTKYDIDDQLVNGLSFTSVPSVKYAGDSTTEVPLVPGTDYNVTPAANPAGVAGANVKVSLTAPGISKIVAARAADDSLKVETTINAFVNGDAMDDLTNEASYTFNDGSTDTTVETGPGGKVEIKMGDQGFVKLDANQKSRLLEGAKFKVYVTHTNTYTGAVQVTGLEGMDGQNQLVSGPNGKFSAEGLRYTAFANNDDLTCPLSGGTPDAACNYYWLVETEAPVFGTEAYQPLAAPIMFTVSDSTIATEIGNVTTASVTGTLPLTGMSGIIFMVLIGGLVLGGAGYGMYRVSRTKA